jgi:hypothetical protein
VASLTAALLARGRLARDELRRDSRGDVPDGDRLRLAGGQGDDRLLGHDARRQPREVLRAHPRHAARPRLPRGRLRAAEDRTPSTTSRPRCVRATTRSWARSGSTTSSTPDTRTATTTWARSRRSKSLTLDDVRAFYKQNYTQGNLVIGLAGGFRRTSSRASSRTSPKLPAGGAARRSVRAADGQAGHAHRDNQARDARDGHLDGLPHPVNARAQGLAGARARRVVPRPAPLVGEPPVSAPARGARVELRRLRLRRILPARHVPVHARPEPRPLDADIPNLDSPRRAAELAVRAARRALRVRQARARGDEAGGLRGHTRLPRSTRTS